MPAEINATLQQQGHLGQVREYQIINGKELRIIQGTGPRQRVYMVHMLALADKSKLRIHIAWGWFYLAIFCLIALLVYMSIRSMLPMTSGTIEFAVIACLTLGAILGIVLVVVNFSRVRVFFSRYSSIPLFDIYINKPDHRSYTSFLNTLNGYLDKTRSFWSLKPDQQIAGEIRMLRRLASEGVISQKDYEHAKSRLFTTSNKQTRKKIA